MTMLKPYTVEYSLRFRKHSPLDHQFYYTDDPLACEEFVRHLLEEGMGIHAVRHDGADLPRAEFDRIVKVAASAAAAGLICASLNLKPEEERHRFGFSA